MPLRKLCEKFLFSVEGETEKLYFDWLQTQINKCDRARKTISINCKISFNPVKILKSIPGISVTSFTHICDIEGPNKSDKSNGLYAIDNNFFEYKKANKDIALDIKYTNFCFELWLILHKRDLFSHFNNKNDYLKILNEIFGTSFDGLKEFKQEKNLKNCFSQLELDDVRNAIKRSNIIMTNNINNLSQKIKLKLLTYFKDNPSLTIHEIVNDMFSKCGIPI